MERRKEWKDLDGTGCLPAVRILRRHVMSLSLVLLTCKVTVMLSPLSLNLKPFIHGLLVPALNIICPLRPHFRPLSASFPVFFRGIYLLKVSRVCQAVCPPRTAPLHTPPLFLLTSLNGRCYPSLCWVVCFSLNSTSSEGP